MLAFTEDSEWFKIVDPILSDKNKGQHWVWSEPTDTSFVLQKNEGSSNKEKEEQDQDGINELDNEFNNRDVEQ